MTVCVEGGGPDGGAWAGHGAAGVSRDTYLRQVRGGHWCCTVWQGEAWALVLHLCVCGGGGTAQDLFCPVRNGMGFLGVLQHSRAQLLLLGSEDVCCMVQALAGFRMAGCG